MILERDLDLEISRATLDGWVLKVGELLVPIVAAMRRELISGSYIQADETPVDVQTRGSGGKNHQAYLWQYSRPGGTAVFDFRMGRGRDGPKWFLGQFEGILQTDVESCRRLQVPARDYFSAVLPGLANLPISCLPGLTPSVWVARHF